MDSPAVVAYARTHDKIDCDVLRRLVPIGKSVAR